MAPAAGVVVAAYCGYKGLDNYGLYAVQVLGMTELQSAGLMTAASYLRPVAALGAGLLADRLGANRVVTSLLGAATVAFFAMLWLEPARVGVTLILGNLMVAVISVYALRGVYFALLQDLDVDRRHTGAAVGVVSVIGYTPDIFFAPVAGRILDAGTAAQGFNNYFLFLTTLSLAGLACSLVLSRHRRLS